MIKMVLYGLKMSFIQFYHKDLIHIFSQCVQFASILRVRLDSHFLPQFPDMQIRV